MNAVMTARCGLNCAECPAHIVLLKDDPELRKKTAEAWSKLFQVSIDPETLFCTGCTIREGPHIGHCAECAVKSCAERKGMANCGFCDSYESCATIQGFIAMAPEMKERLEKIRIEANGFLR